jgi:hypothetical protein
MSLLCCHDRLRAGRVWRRQGKRSIGKNRGWGDNLGAKVERPCRHRRIGDTRSSTGALHVCLSRCSSEQLVAVPPSSPCASHRATCHRCWLGLWTC